MSTGVTCSDEVIAQFTSLKLGRISNKYAIYKIEDGRIVPDILGEPDASFEEFTAHLPPNECRYAMYDCIFTTNDGRPGKKLVNIIWSPETSSVKGRMLYAGSKSALVSALEGVATKVQATDMSELTIEILMEACKKFA